MDRKASIETLVIALICLRFASMFFERQSSESIPSCTRALADDGHAKVTSSRSFNFVGKTAKSATRPIKVAGVL